jgi:hypothetical protein
MQNSPSFIKQNSTSKIKKTGKIITVKSKGNLFEYKGELYRDYPHVDLMKGYTPIKTKIWYLVSRL